MLKRRRPILWNGLPVIVQYLGGMLFGLEVKAFERVEQVEEI